MFHTKARFPLPKLTARVDGRPVSITRQLGPSTRPSTRLVETGLNARFTPLRKAVLCSVYHRYRIHVDGDKGYKWIQLVFGLHIRCKRVITLPRLHLIHVARIQVSCFVNTMQTEIYVALIAVQCVRALHDDGNWPLCSGYATFCCCLVGLYPVFCALLCIISAHTSLMSGDI